MYDITALGELLIDFTESGTSENGNTLFEQNPGGAPANVLALMSGFGLKTAFIGKVGADMHGDFLRETLNNRNISTQGLISDPNVFTTLAFVKLTNGERSFSFARKPGADTMLTSNELDMELIKNTKIFHFGSLSLTNEPSRSATITAINTAKSAGALISYDPNYRAPLWKSKTEAITQMRSVINLTDIIKISDEETELLTDNSAPEKAAKVLLEQGLKCVVVTLGEKGALASTKNGSIHVNGFTNAVVDTTGAGDTFWGSFLYKLLKGEKDVSKLSMGTFQEYVSFANAAAALCIGKRGAIPSMPNLNEVLENLKRWQ